MRWRRRTELAARGPQFPYAHWWLEQTRRPENGQATRFLEMRGDRLTALKPRLLDCSEGRDGCTALKNGTQANSAVPRDSRLTPVNMPEDLINMPEDLINENSKETESSGPDINNAAGVASAKGILAIIDGGIAFANERFRSHVPQNGGPAKVTTRFDWLWLQGVPNPKTPDPKTPDPKTPGTKPGQPFGRELNHEEINALLDKHRVAGSDTDIDEDALYRDAGLINFSRPERQYAGSAGTHGTGVLDQAAGYDPDDPDGGRIAIIGVELPSRVIRDTSGTFMDIFVVLAIRRILARAAALRKLAGKPDKLLPVVINLSLSLSAGPKDGTSLIDRCIAAEIARAEPGQLHFVVPTGNHRLSRTHIHLKRAEMEPAPVLRWRVLPDDLTPSFVEIWLNRQMKKPPLPTAVLSVCPPGCAPGSNHRPAVTVFGSYRDLKQDSKLLARAYHSWHPDDPKTEDGPGRQRIILAVPPTASYRRDPTTAPSGVWSLQLHLSGSAEPLAADIYVQRDDSLPGFGHNGRQSHFEDSQYRERDNAGRLIDTPEAETGPLTRRGTLNAFCAGKDTVAAGACSARERVQMPYSGYGADTDIKPDVLAVADASLIHRGVLTSGTFSGSRVLISGTSIAAPKVARALLAQSLPVQGMGFPQLPLSSAPIDGIRVLGSSRTRKMRSGDRVDLSQPVEAGPAPAQP